MKTILVKKPTSVLVLLTVLFAVANRGAAQTAPNGIVIKGKAPVSKEILRVKLPKAQEAVLPNGLRVLLLENHKIPTFLMRMVVLGGGLSDPPSASGTAIYIAALLREGTTTRTSREIAEQSESLGATIYVDTRGSLLTFTSSVNVGGLSENFDQTLDIFADVIRNPAFPAEEVEKYKQRMIAQSESERTIPSEITYYRIYKSVYSENPPVAGSVSTESVRAMMPQTLKEFHRLFYRPNNAILAVTGDITMKELMPKLEKAFGDWQRGSFPAVQIPTVFPPHKPGFFLINRPGSVQTSLALGSFGIKRDSPDYFAVLVMNQILGGTSQARLFTNLREEKGYTFGAFSSFSGSKYPGFIMLSSEVRTEVTAGALKEFMYEIRRIRDEKVPADELENAKSSLVGGFALSLERPRELLSDIVTQKLYNFPASYWDDYPQAVAKITAEDVQRVARKYLDPSRMQIAAVEDAAKIRDVLAAYGSVEQYDAEGRIIKPEENGRR